MTTEGIAGRIASGFINSKLTPLLMAVFMGIGIYSAWLTPKEEDPQIQVPMADISVMYPGASPEEIEKRVVEPIEHLLANIEGVEYVYASALPQQALVSVRYFVGEDVEGSLVKLYEELLKRADEMPSGASMPLIKTRDVDDVPVLALTLHSDTYDDFDLRRIGAELKAEIKKIDGVAEVDLKGGRRRQIRIELDPNRLAAYALDPVSIADMILASNTRRGAGSFSSNDTEYLVETGGFLTSVDEVANLVVGVHQGHPVRLGAVAHVSDGPAEPDQYVSFGYGAGAGHRSEAETETAINSDFQDAHLVRRGVRTAVTIAVAKRAGRDAMTIASAVERKVDGLRDTLIPSGVSVTETRNYGESASDKVFELLLHLLVAIGAVTVVVGMAMGWRGGLVVFLSVPISFALTLFVYYMFGYTLNRITLFALIFVTGIVVDDSIIIAENMERHFKMRKQPFAQAAMSAINEVGNPTILATLTVIAAVLPMAFVSGLMGPYMSPMPIGASMAMMFSLLVALIITPFLAYRLLEKQDKKRHERDYRLEDTAIYRAYHATIRPLLNRRPLRWSFLGITALLLVGSISLFYFKVVTVKMLPYDNKSEFQVVVDMPEGSTLERTQVVVRELGLYLARQPEVTDYQTYVGTASPVNLNGLVRHYDLRRSPHQADIQVNLLPKDVRDEQSHPIAKRMRPALKTIGDRYGATIKIAEVPPGPPVLSTLVAEIYGPDLDTQRSIARQVVDIFRTTEGVVDADWSVEDDQTKYSLVVDRVKALLAGVSSSQITNSVSMALDGQNVSTLRLPDEREPLAIHIRLAEEHRSSLADLGNLRVRTGSGAMVPVADLVTTDTTTADKHIDRKNQRRVVYVTGDVAGDLESPIYAMMNVEERLHELDLPTGYGFETLYTDQPFLENNVALKWDGEWRITYKVFRDLGIAFAVVLIVIYLLIVGWFQDLTTPFVMMIAIPLSLIGIVAGHWMLGAFFTATSMIGFIALAGIMVRNSVLLIDFINLRLDAGVALRRAVIEAGAVRTRPILLTAGTVVIGAFVILFDPIFQGLAISLMGGAIASTALTLIIVPLIYFMVENRKPAVVSPSRD